MDKELREELDLLVRLGRKYKWATGSEREYLEERGVNLVRSDFYSEAPSQSEINNSFEYENSSSVEDTEPVFDSHEVFDAKRILEFTEEILPFAKEFSPPEESLGSGYYWGNSQFSFNDAMALYGLIRRYQPKCMVEIGCGFSSWVASEAFKKNGFGRLICIDPEPRTDIRSIESIEFLEEPIQKVPMSFFNDQLMDGDIVFYDGSHTIKSGSDTVYFYLKLLPFLRSRLFVHAHDVRLPYPRNKKALLEAKLYWGETYILSAHLFNTQRYRVLYGSEFLRRRHAEKSQEMMNGYYSSGGVSLWYEVNYL